MVAYDHRMQTEKTPAFHYRLGLNQPIGSPTARRLAEMAEAISRDTNGAFRLDVFPESRLGPDPQMLADMHDGKLEFFVAGATLGGLAPSSALPLLPFAFAELGGGVCGARRRARRSEFAMSWRSTASMPFATAYKTDFTI